MTRIEVTRISAYGLLCDADRILLCRLSQGVAGAGMWTLPGGGIEFGEHPEAAIFVMKSKAARIDVSGIDSTRFITLRSWNWFKLRCRCCVGDGCTGRSDLLIAI